MNIYIKILEQYSELILYTFQGFILIFDSNRDI